MSAAWGKRLGIALLLVSAALAQGQSSPLSVLDTKTRMTPDGNAQETTVEYQNASDKEMSVAVFEFTYTDKLDRVTEVVTNEPITVHESGHRTLRPGKKNKAYFGPTTLHLRDQVKVRVTIVKFVDGSKWEADKP